MRSAGQSAANSLLGFFLIPLLAQILLSETLAHAQLAPTATSVKHEPNPSTFGQTVTLTAEVQGNGVHALSGTVTTDGAAILRTTPLDAIPTGLAVTAIAAGLYHTCALTSSGGIKCWGDNRKRQLGDGTTTDRSTPVEVHGLTSEVTAIAAGFHLTCALISAGGVKCWGDNSYSQLGDGTTVYRINPVDVRGLTRGVSAIAAGFHHTCALTSAGGVKCWGFNSNWQLGDGTTADRSTPVDVHGLTSEVTAIAAGGYHTCALTSSGGVKCWGLNRNSQLGEGTTARRTKPVDVKGLSREVSSIAAGFYHTCALTSVGGIKCWGDNRYSQLSDGTTTAYRTKPVDVEGLSRGVSAIAAGYLHNCALLNAGGVKCWGDNRNSQLGVGTTARHTKPVNVHGLTRGVSAIAAGGYHTCALTSAGRVKCWGENLNGQVGDGTTANRPTPVDVEALNSF